MRSGQLIINAMLINGLNVLCCRADTAIQSTGYIFKDFLRLATLGMQRNCYFKIDNKQRVPWDHHSQNICNIIYTQCFYCLNTPFIHP